MREEVVWDLTLGKVVEDFVISRVDAQMIVCFDDNTFTVFGATCGYGGVAAIKPCKLDLFGFGDGQLVEACIVGEQEMKSMRKEWLAGLEMANEDSEHRAYERLKKKFEVDG